MIYCIIIHSTNFGYLLSVKKMLCKETKQGMVYHYVLL